MSRIDKRVFIGQGGKVFIDGELEAEVKELTIKTTGKFNDLDKCGIFGTECVYEGYDTDGTMTVYMTDTDYAEEITESFRTGVFRDRTIVTKLTNPNTGKEASYSIPEVIFTETPVVTHKKGVIEYTLPFKCAMPVKL